MPAFCQVLSAQGSTETPCGSLKSAPCCLLPAGRLLSCPTPKVADVTGGRPRHFFSWALAFSWAQSYCFIEVL